MYIDKSNSIPRNFGFSSEADEFLTLSFNITMAVFEHITEELTKIVALVDDESNSSPVFEISVNALLAEFPHSLDYVTLASQYYSLVIRSWIESISKDNWTDVSLRKIKFIFISMFHDICQCFTVY